MRFYKNEYEEGYFEMKQGIKKAEIFLMSRVCKLTWQIKEFFDYIRHEKSHIQVWSNSMPTEKFKDDESCLNGGR